MYVPYRGAQHSSSSLGSWSPELSPVSFKINRIPPIFKSKVARCKIINMTNPKVDPKDLTNLFFSDDHKLFDGFFVHPSITISKGKDIVHGRGLIVNQDIQAGECLFVTPPTVGIDQLNSNFLEGENSSKKLEDVAMDLLQENMMEAVRRNEYATMNSFLALMGIPGSKEDEKDVNIDLLNGEDDGRIWSDEELNSVTKKHLRSIILKNAFGPDFITYDKIQQQWQTSNSSYSPPHILGIYPLAAMLNHSCSANAIRSYANETMIVHASKPIAAGSEVVWSYIPPTQIFAERRRALKKRHGFMCRCERCVVESKQLKKDMLPSNLKMALEEGSKWNKNLLDVSSSDDVSKRQLCSAYVTLEETVFGSTNLSNEVKRHLRVGYTNLHFNYFNAVLSTIDNGVHALHAKQIREMVLASATQLHFAFCSSNNASTEHISILHLCYELINAIHRTNSDKSKTLNKVKFWTDAMKRAHMVRYGEMRSDLEAVRNCLVHTRTILRQRDGFLKVKYNFL